MSSNPQVPSLSLSNPTRTSVAFFFVVMVLIKGNMEDRATQSTQESPQKGNFQPVSTFSLVKLKKQVSVFYYIHPPSFSYVSFDNLCHPSRLNHTHESPYFTPPRKSSPKDLQQNSKVSSTAIDVIFLTGLALSSIHYWLLFHN